MKKDMFRSMRVLLVTATLLGMAGVVQAQDSVPAVVNFQGTLFDPSAVGGTGGPLTGVQQVEFRIYDNLTSGTLIWGRSFPVYCNDQGIFNVLMNDSGTWLGGATNSLSAAFQGPNRFLELSVGGHTILPRQQFASAPYAMHSAYSTYANVAPQGFEVDNHLTVASGGIDVTGQGTFQNNVTVNGALTANTLTVTNGTVVSGSLTANSLSVVADANVSGALQVGGRIQDKSGLVAPVGMVIPYAGSAIPAGWLECDGRPVSRTSYADLYAAIGTAFGSGDNTSTFNIPDMRGRAAIGAGQGTGLSNRTLAGKVGEEAHTLIASEMPSHTHGISVYSQQQGYLGAEQSHGYWKDTANSTTGTAGQDQPHNNMPPSIVLKYIVKY